jgi:hypothetical protein
MNLKRLAVAFGIVACSLSAQAQNLPPLEDLEFVGAPGQACEFSLGIDIVGGNQVNRTFTDRNGNVRILSAGQGSQLTFYNLSTANVLSLRPNGSVSHITVNPDGTQSIVGTGHNVIVLFDTDPGGPDASLYVGRIEFLFNPETGFTQIFKFNGKSTDICAALS